MSSQQRRGQVTVTVIGAGAAGLACAWRLAGAGLEVTLIDAGSIESAGEEGGPGNALWASGGMLAPGFETACELDAASPLAQNFSEFAHGSARQWPSWAQRLEAETGISIAYEQRGSLTPIFTAMESERAARAIQQARALNVEVERWSAPELAAAEPSLAKGLGALSFPQDGQVDNRALARALTEACRQRGVVFQSRIAVTGIQARPQGGVDIVLDSAASIPADNVIIATGSREIPGLETEIEMVPVKGQMIALAASRPLAPSRVIRSFGIYLASKPGLRLVVGATSEPELKDQATDAASVEALRLAACSVLPGLEAVPVLEQWAGLRPRSRDGMPVIGQLTAGIWIAGGGYRNGVLLAPAMAEAILAGITTGRVPAPASAFSPDRLSLSSVKR